jgi:capsular polysaccharide biosynthesis protein
VSKKHGRGAETARLVRPAPAARTTADELASQLVAEAAKAQSLGLVDDARAMCESALILGPTAADVLLALAERLRLLGLVPAAIVALKRIVAGDSAAPMPVYSELIRSLLVHGLPADAAAVCRKGLAAHGENGELLCGLGAALRREGRTSAAVATLQRAIHRPDALPEAHGELALALMAQGRYGDAVQEQARVLYLEGLPLAGRHIGAYRTRSVRGWCESHGASIQTVIPARPGRAFKPRYGGAPGPCESADWPQPEVYLAEVPDATILCGQSAVFASDDTALLDPLFWPNASRLDLAEPVVPYLERDGALVDVPSTAAETIPAGIGFHGFGVRNYYHWLVEYLPRLLVLERCGVNTDVPLLVDRRTYEVPQLADALRAVDRSNRPVITLEPDVEYKVGRLLVAGALAWGAPNLKDRLELELGDNLIAPEAIDFIRERLGVAANVRTGRRRLYVARRAATSPTRLANEPEVQEVFRACGFEAVHPDGLSFAEQRELFADAAMVASESGAGLANLLLAPSGATLICLQAEEMAMNVYADIAGLIGQPALFVAGDVVGERPVKPYHARFTVSPDRLRRVLDSIVPATA